MSKAPFGWTALVKSPTDVRVYKRDCPADAKHFAEDLAPYTRPTRKEAEVLAQELLNANSKPIAES
jgi:hypothetical protein